MATTAPAISASLVCINSTGLQLTHCTSLTAQQLAMVPPSATPAPWNALTMDPTSCGCGCTDHL